VSDADELRAENARLWAENNRLRAQARDVEYFEQLAARMEGSVSWKITAPLRTAKRVAGIVRRELEERRG
jgi:hypothetical protein